MGCRCRVLARRGGRSIRIEAGADDILGTVRTTRVVLATAHRDHDTANNVDRNLVP